MSVRTMATVWEKSQHSGSELLMLLAIADFADDNGRAYPSITTLATKCRTKPRYAIKLLDALSASGELEIRKQQGPMGRGGRTNLYRVALERMGRPHEVVNHSAPVNPDAVVHQGARSSEPGFREVVNPSAPKPPLNQENHQTKARKRAGDPVGFNQFWSVWPQTDRKQDRKKCAAAWAKLNPDAVLTAQILAHVEACKQSRKWRDGYEPAPLTYLRGERWLDGMPDGAQPTRKSPVSDVFEGAH